MKEETALEKKRRLRENRRVDKMVKALVEEYCADKEPCIRKYYNRLIMI